MHSISVLMKPSSGMCNMHCDYCFYTDETKNRQEASYGFMSDATLKNIIRKTISKADLISYVYQGGEPLLRGLEFFRQAIKYQKQYVRENTKVCNSLQTNGYMLDEEWCRFFAENNFLLGVSLDGIRPTHDKFRHSKTGEGSYDKVKKNIQLLDKYKVDYNILTVITRDVALNLEKIYKEYKDNGWFYQQYIACLDPLDCEKGKMPYSLTPDVYGEFLIKLFELWYADFNAGSPGYIRQFENWGGMAAGYIPEACDMSGICSLQNVVEADGSVYPCDFYVLDEYKLGNFNENRLDTIIERYEQSGFTERSYLLGKECRECEYYKLCRGGCQRNRISEGDYYKNYFCEAYKSFFSHCGDKINKLTSKI